MMRDRCGVPVALALLAVSLLDAAALGRTAEACDPLGVGDCCAPRLIIVGAMKCGTNALMAYLSKHPVFSASWKESEINFFSRQLGSVEHGSVEARREYARHLICADPTSSLWAVDKSPDYLFTSDPVVAQRAHSVAPSAKVVAVLCDPAVRLWKEWWHNMRIFEPHVCQAAAVSLTAARSAFDDHIAHQLELHRAGWNPNHNLSIAKGMYSDNLKPWVETFGAENVLAVDSTFRLKHHRTETVEAVLRFLGLDPSLLQAHEEAQFRDVYYTTHPHLHHSAWQRLHSFYAKSNRELAALLGQAWVKDWEHSFNPHWKETAEEARRLKTACGRASNGLRQATRERGLL